jgi:GAF domain-containing protein
VEVALAELSKTNREATRQIWSTVFKEGTSSSYEYDGLQIRAVPQSLAPTLLHKLEEGQHIIVKQEDNDDGPSKNTLLVPLMVMNQMIGVVGLDQEDSESAWSEEQIAIAQAAANRAALTLENARLLNESLRRAAKERTIFEATSRIGSALSIENILQTTAEEIERVLGGSEVVLQFNTDKKSSARED